MLPFGNRTVIETLTGAQFTAALLNGFSRRRATRRSPPAASRRSPGSRSRSTATASTPVVDGIVERAGRPGGPLTPIGPADTIRIVTNDFMFTGGDGYTAFAAAPTCCSRATRCSTW